MSTDSLALSALASSDDLDTQIDALLDLRQRAAQAYFEGKAFMSDSAFDALDDELDKLGYEAPVGQGAVAVLNKVKHARRMLSIDKVRTREEIAKWLGETGLVELAAQLKYDGAALSITYVGGKLERAITRGDGVQGEDITRAIAVMAQLGHLPLELADGLDMEVRGEVYIRTSDFEMMNAIRLAQGKEEYSNERNTAAGITRRSEPDAEMLKFVSFVAYDAESTQEPFASDAALISWLSQAGFVTPTDHKGIFSACTVDELMEVIDAVDKRRTDLGFDIDGVVIKAAQRDDRLRLGESRTAPNWVIAYKYESIPKQTVLREVLWQPTRTGKLNPVGVFDVVKLAKANCTRATLHNLDEIERLDIRLGDNILAARMNEIIPKILERVGEHVEDSVQITYPEECPNCGAETYRDGVNLMCRSGRACNVIREIVYSLQCLDILGISTALIRSLMQAGLIANFIDLLNVTEEQIAALPRKGEKSAAKDYLAIQGVYERPLYRWIMALGMSKIATSSEKLEKKYGSLDALAQATEEELLSLDKFGPIKSTTVLVSSPKIQNWADRLRTEHDFVPTPEVIEVPSDSQFAGKVVVVTGTFPTMKRKDVETWLKSQGASIGSGVNASTDLLIAGEKAGSKMAAAAKHGTQVMDAADFEALLS